MPASTPTIPGSRRARSALGAVLLAASIALAGCSSPTETPASETEDAPDAGFVYEAPDQGYAVTFPGEPDVQTIPLPGTDVSIEVATFVSMSSGTTFATQGFEAPAEVTEEQLSDALSGAITGGGEGFTDSTQPEPIEVAGLAGLKSDVTTQAGAGTIIVTSQGRMLYQLVAVGGDAADRQAFFDSFALLG